MLALTKLTRESIQRAARHYTRRHRMKQLSSLDAQSLAQENARQTGHVAGLAVHNPSTAPSGTLTAASMMELLRDPETLL